MLPAGGSTRTVIRDTQAPVVTLDAPDDNDSDDCDTKDDALVDEIRANPAGFYVNVHTAELPAGAIRGQLVASSSGDGARTSFIPVVGKVSGANNTNFITDLRIVNNGSSVATVILDYYAQNGGGLAAPTTSRTLPVGAGPDRPHASAGADLRSGLGC